MIFNMVAGGGGGAGTHYTLDANLDNLSILWAEDGMLMYSDSGVLSIPAGTLVTLIDYDGRSLVVDVNETEFGQFADYTWCYVMPESNATISEE